MCHIRTHTKEISLPSFGTIHSTTAKGYGSFIAILAIAICLLICGAQARKISPRGPGESAHARSNGRHPFHLAVAGNAPPLPIASSVLLPLSNPPNRGCSKVDRCRQFPPALN
ncbi:BPI2 domain-containing protein [Psidium guajava]|nr:BPI2 domain-containing protein [Psidium guajava]